MQCVHTKSISVTYCCISVLRATLNEQVMTANPKQHAAPCRAPWGKNHLLGGGMHRDLPNPTGSLHISSVTLPCAQLSLTPCPCPARPGTIDKESLPPEILQPFPLVRHGWQPVPWVKHSNTRALIVGPSAPSNPAPRRRASLLH